MIAADILSDAVFAAVAGVGFGAVSDPPLKAFGHIAVLAAAGHALRYCLMNFAGIDLAVGSLAAAVLIGFASLWLGRRSRIPMTVLYIPALLPMIPGKYAYNMVFSQMMFMQNLGDPQMRTMYMDMFFSNAMVTGSVVFMLAAGATLPIFIFPGAAYSVTRRKGNEGDILEDGGRL